MVIEHIKNEDKSTRLLKEIHKLDNACFSKADQLSFSRFRDQLDKEELFIMRYIGFKAVLPNTLVGYATCSFSSEAKIGYLSSSCVLENWRGVGIGKDFLIERLNFLYEKGVQKVQAHTRKDNIKMISLLKKYHFESIQYCSDYYSDGAAAILWRKKISYGNIL